MTFEQTFRQRRKELSNKEDLAYTERMSRDFSKMKAFHSNVGLRKLGRTKRK